MTAPARQYWRRVAFGAGNAFYAPRRLDAVNVKRVKLFTAPHLLGIGRKTRSRDLRSSRELLRIKTFPFPFAIDHRIAQRSAVRSLECTAIVSFEVLVRVTPGTRIQSRLHRLDAF